MSLQVSATLAATISYTASYDSADLGTGIYTDNAAPTEAGTYVLAGGNSTVTTSFPSVGTTNATITGSANSTAIATDSHVEANAARALTPLVLAPALLLLL